MYNTVLVFAFIILLFDGINCNMLKRHITTMLNTKIINSKEFASDFDHVTRPLCSLTMDRRPFSFHNQGNTCYTAQETEGSHQKYILGPSPGWNTYIDPAWGKLFYYVLMINLVRYWSLMFISASDIYALLTFLKCLTIHVYVVDV